VARGLGLGGKGRARACARSCPCPFLGAVVWLVIWKAVLCASLCQCVTSESESIYSSVLVLDSKKTGRLARVVLSGGGSVRHLLSSTQPAERKRQ
jgi:hypothetical protein